MRRLALAMILSSVLAPAAYPQAGAHGPPSSGIAIEHAEVLLPPSDSPTVAVAYLAIWNGLPTQVNLTAVESEAFGAIELQQTIQDGGVSRRRRMDGVISIPGHAELLMASEGIHLTLSSPRTVVASGQQVSVTAVFADGTRLTTNANVLPAGALPTDHHHGEGDGAGDE